jgi:hypothetical protein
MIRGVSSPHISQKGFYVKIPTLSLQKAQGQEWGTRFIATSS